MLARIRPTSLFNYFSKTSTRSIDLHKLTPPTSLHLPHYYQQKHGSNIPLQSLSTLLQSSPLTLNTTLDLRLIQFSQQRRTKKKKAKNNKTTSSDEDQAAEEIDLKDMEDRMQKLVKSYEDKLIQFRDATASPAILDNVQVECYGSQAPLKKVAQVSLKDPKTLSVSLFDPTLTKAVHKAILNANLNLNPLLENQGRLKIPIPKPSSEDRENLKRGLLKEAEGVKAGIRGVRQEVMKAVKGVKGKVPDNEWKLLEREVQGCTGKWNEVVDKRTEAKIDAIFKK